MTPTSQPSVHVLLLAAGGSSRLGQPKQLVKLKKKSLLETVASRAVSVCGGSVTVVVGAHASELTPRLQHLPVSIAINRGWREGLSSSIRRGIAATPASADAALIMLCDQALVTGDDLRRLINAWAGNTNAIAASMYGATVGVPAIFPRWCFSELASLRGDHGARPVIHRNLKHLIRVPMPNARFDLDNEIDLRRIQKQFED